MKRYTAYRISLFVGDFVREKQAEVDSQVLLETRAFRNVSIYKLRNVLSLLNCCSFYEISVMIKCYVIIEQCFFYKMYSKKKLNIMRTVLIDP